MIKFILNVLLLSSIISISSSCKKESKEMTSVDFHIFNPVTKENFDNVPVKIYRVKTGLLKNKKELIWEGETNEKGYAHCRYYAWEFYKYYYFPVIDTNKGYPNDHKLIFKPSSYYSIVANELNELNYRFVRDIQWIHHFKNINCYDENDKVRWRYRNPTTSGEDNTWSNWFPSNGEYFEGCEEVLTATRVDEQTIFYSQLEVTKNDSTYYVEDTMYLTGENGVDTLRLYY